MSELKYPHLFAPLQVGDVIYRNRIFSAPTGHLDVSVEGVPGSICAAYYERKALGGAATVTIGECSVDRARGTRGRRHVNLQNPDNVHPLNRLARAIRSGGAVPSVELQHGGYAANSIGVTGPAYSAIALEYGGKQVQMMDEDLILETIGLFADAAKFAKACGFGMVTVHGAHGWLIQQFFSPAFNTRTDRWGGSDENRARFAVAICDAIHEKCGRGFPVEMRIGGSEIEPGGYGVEGGIAFARQLDGHADIIHVSVGSVRPGVHTFSSTHPSMFREDGCNVQYAAAIKKEVHTSLVATVGGLIEPEQMEEIIATGQADIVAGARSLICDPDLPNKAREGRPEDIRRCMRCFTCFQTLMGKGDMLCALNPEMGRDLEVWRSLPPTEPKKVLVAGGGIAGMQAAETAAKNGHTVILCEKSDHLGGAISCEDKVPFKKNLAAYIRQQAEKLPKLGVEVRLNTAVTPELARELQPDVIVAALGSEAAVPAVCRGTGAIGAEEAYSHPEKVGGRAVILGGGLVGTELAVYLSTLGKACTILEATGRYNDGGSSMHFGTVREQLTRWKVETRFNTTAEKIAPEGVTCSDGSFIPADTMIYAAGRVRRSAEAAALSGCARQFIQLGDCLKVANIQAATSTAWTEARNIGRFSY